MLILGWTSKFSLIRKKIENGIFEWTLQFFLFHERAEKLGFLGVGE